MALQTSGAISMSDIAAEFGGSTPHSINEYYGAASGIPSSGTISMNQFYGASAGSIPPSVSWWVVGGGGGGGGWSGETGGGGGGAGAEVITHTYSSISSGETFNWIIGAGGNVSQSGGFTRVYANNRNTITAQGGGHGASRTSSGASSPGCSAGGSKYHNGAGKCFFRTQGDGGDYFNASMGSHNAGGGGGGANYTHGGDAFIPSGFYPKGGLGGAGVTVSTGLSSSLVLGKGGDGGVSRGFRASSGDGAGALAYHSSGFTHHASPGAVNSGGGGGGGAEHSGTVYSAGAGGSGVVIMQYPDNLAPTSITGSYTLQEVGGYKTYIFTSTGSLTW